ncbi:MAG: polymorphic toxin type 4 domain-containing protein [Pseudomonadota bacterium]
MASDPSKLTAAEARFLETHLGLHIAAHQRETPGLAEVLARLDQVVFSARLARGEGLGLEATLSEEAGPRFLPNLDILSDEERTRLDTAYFTSLRAIAALQKTLEARLADGSLTDDDIDVAAGFWASQPTMTAAQFANSPALGRYELDEQPSPILGHVPAGALATAPVQASGPVHNPGPGRAVQAPSSIMDDATRRALSGHGAPSLVHDIAGTGGIKQIRATRRDDGSMSVSITGEILPGRLHRGAGDPNPGQTVAPDFNTAGRSAQRPIGELGLNDPGRWQRLHLWGPGFGDEAAAGMFLGPEEVNQEFQNRGIERVIRDLGRLAAPLRGEGYVITVTATAESWSLPTPTGFATDNNERLFKSAVYEITLEAPIEAGGTTTDRAAISVELDTDPGEINDGKAPKVIVSVDHDAFRTMVGRLPIQ